MLLVKSWRSTTCSKVCGRLKLEIQGERVVKVFFDRVVENVFANFVGPPPENKKLPVDRVGSWGNMPQRALPEKVVTIIFCATVVW